MNRFTPAPQPDRRAILPQGERRRVPASETLIDADGTVHVYQYNPLEDEADWEHYPPRSRRAS